MPWTSFSPRITHFSPDDQGMIQKAFEMGMKAHEGQMRQSGEPYFNHPIAVAEIMIGLGADRDSVIAALLHDTVEDTPVTLMDIHDTFGDGVATLVDGATKLMEADKEKNALVSTDDKIETLRKIFTYMEKDVRIMVLKLADRLHNMQTLKFRNPEKQKAVAKETLDVYAKIADRLCMRDMMNDLQELCYDILEPAVYKDIQRLSDENKMLGNEKIPMLQKRIAQEFPKERVEMEYKKKSWKRMHLEHALEKQYQTKQHAVNLVILCDSVDGCYHMLGILHRLYQREALTFDDFINLPAINGYQGLHTTIILEDGTRMRCKLRTHEMNEYAHKGVATKCFDSKAIGIVDYLPWAKHISPLANDTKDRSQEFWESLQSDILSESIIVYGTNTSALIPEGATVLDAALHLFPEEALRLTSVRINGKEVSFAQKIERGALVEIETSPEKTVQHDWLYWVETGIGIAKIRAALAVIKGTSLAESGADILQHTLTERGLGYLEEFDASLLQSTSALLGYASTGACYEAVAQRRLEPDEFIDALLQSASKHQGAQSDANEKKDIVFTFVVDRNIEGIRKLLNVYEKFTSNTKNIRMWPGLGNTMHFRARIGLTQKEETTYQQELIAAGAKKLSMHRYDRLAVVLMAVVIFCWGLNPVWAKYFLLNGLTPATLVSLRSIIFGVFSVILFLFWRTFRKASYAPIPNIMSLAFLPTVATYVLSFFTYASISYLPPSLHLTILRFNVVFLPLLHLKNKKVFSVSSLVSFAFFAVFLLLCSFIPGMSHAGLPLAAVALVAYLIYSIITENVLQRNRIGVRYPYFLLHMGIMLAVFGLLYFPWIIINEQMWLQHLPALAAYVFICVFIPHTCFQLILQRTRFLHVTSLSLFEVPLGILLETVILGVLLSPYAYALMAVTVLSLAFLLYRKEVKLADA